MADRHFPAEPLAEWLHDWTSVYDFGPAGAAFFMASAVAS